jgi:hypothetical protein
LFEQMIMNKDELCLLVMCIFCHFLDNVFTPRPRPNW